MGFGVYAVCGMAEGGRMDVAAACPFVSVWEALGRR